MSSNEKANDYNEVREKVIAQTGVRLTEERKRLKLRAVDVYTELAIHQHTYKNYETGSRDIPSSLLHKLWDLGFDILYVVTGVYMDDSLQPATELPATHIPPSSNSPTTATTTTQPLVQVPDVHDKTDKSDQLLLAMQTIESSLMQAGATPKNDYSYMDLMGMAIKFVGD